MESFGILHFRFFSLFLSLPSSSDMGNNISISLTLGLFDFLLVHGVLQTQLLPGTHTTTRTF